MPPTVCMMEQFVTLIASLLCCSSASAVDVFYVVPTNPVTECPFAGNSCCHSLQYYANHSTFTNNSMFLFLEGEHHLESEVDIRNVANLSLVGATAGVEIVCESFSAGFRVERFTKLSFENLTILNCTSVNKASVYLITGSEVALSHVYMVSNIYSYDLLALDVEGLFNSSVVAGQILAKYSICSKQSLFHFSSNNVEFETGLKFMVYCSGLQILLSDSILSQPLEISLNVLTNNSVLVYNSVLYGGMEFHTCTGSCNKSDLHCNHDLAKFSGVNFHGSQNGFHTGHTVSLQNSSCDVSIEDSVLNDSTVYIEGSLYSATLDSGGTIETVFLNTRFFNKKTTLEETPAFIISDAVVLFVGCTFEHNIGSAIEAHRSEVAFQGNNTFRDNSALVGGAMKLLDYSVMSMRPHTHILFEENHANYVGGAIYTDYKATDTACFFSLMFDRHHTIKVTFINNTADIAGSSLYGHITDCCITLLCKEFLDIFRIYNTETDPSAIASDPFEVCLCNKYSNRPTCVSKQSISWYAFPGQDFTVRLALVGEFGGVVSAAIRAYFPFPYNATLGRHQMSQGSGTASCNDFFYSVSTLEKIVRFKLIPDHYVLTSGREEFSVTVHLKDCPLGFSLSHSAGRCVCDPVISRDNIECFINNQSILRPANSWIGIIKRSSTILFHPNCPIWYCLPDDVNITVNTSDSQCEPHRTGLLCGKCEEGYSLTLGKPKCAECTNTNLYLVLPLAMAGLFLVAVLFAFNLTVTEGDINGLIFYANVIGMNYPILFSNDASYLYIFLAWLNLDLGISTCLFNGMNGYAVTWLQFVFPVYLWGIILLIILLYRKFPTISSKLGGENAVKVLATLLLLSYTKLQQTVVTILSFTKLEYPGGVVRYVWLYDANMEFFKGKHLYLGLAAILILVFLIIPYTLCLAFFQQLQACSGHRLFQWVNKLKPVFDAYAGPYKDKYRFWTGLLLVVRTLLIILFTSNTSVSADFNLLIVSVVSCALLIATANGVYKKWLCNYLESFFYVQLVIFAVGVAYARHNHGNTTAVADTSIALTIVASLAVLGYHVLHRVKSFRLHYHHLRGYADIEEEGVSLTHERIVT